MQNMSVRLFGPFRAYGPDGDVVAFPSRKVAALLAYVAAQPDRVHTRTGLARLFWPDLPERSAQNNLRVTLARLKALSAASPVLESSAGTVGLAGGGTPHSDVAEFERLLAATLSHEHERRAGCGVCRKSLLEIDALYRGPFLEGLELPECHAFETWHVETANRFRLAVVDVLRDLAHGYEAHDDRASAEFCVRRLLALDPLHDEGNVTLMRVVSRQGRRNEAIAHFHRFAASLKAELDVEPDDAAITLLHQLQTAPRRAPHRVVTRSEGSARLLKKGSTVIGRETELLRVGDLLQARPLVTLHGIGGTGKTTLAAELVQRLAGRYADGIFEVRLSTVTSADAVPMALARAVGRSPRADRDALAHLLEYLSPRKMLLVLDAFEHLLDARTSVAAIARAAPDVRILVTSREPLGLAEETTVLVSGLDHLSVDVPAPTAADVAATSAGALFIDMAQRVRSEFDPTPDDANAIATICRLVRGHPLAVILAATWLDVSSCADIALEVVSSIELLATRSDHLPEDQRSLAAVFDRSWHALSADERDVLAAMGVFRDGFDRAAGRDVAGATLPILGRLVRHALVTFDPRRERYDLHDLVRHFATAKLGETGREAIVRARHAAHYLERLDRWDEQSRAESRDGADVALEHDLGNVTDAWRTTAASHDVASLPPRVAGLRRFVTTHHREHLLIDLLEPLREGARIGDLPRDQEVGVLLALALAYRLTRGFMAPELATVHARVVELAESLDDSPELFTALYGLWSYQGMVGALDEAEAVLALWRRRLEGAGARSRNAFLDDAYLVLLDAEGVTHVYRGAFAMAQKRFEEAMARYRPEHHRAFIHTYGMDPGVYCRAWLALCYWLDGRVDAATAMSDEAIELASTLGHPHTTAFTLQHGVILSAWERDHERGARLVDALLRLAETHRLPFFAREAETYGALARLGAGSVDALDGLAARLGAHAPNAYKAVLSAPLLDALHTAGAHEEVLSLAGACLALPFATCAAELHRLRAEALLATGATSEAEASFRSAIDTARQQGASVYELRAAARFGEWLVERGDRDEAIRLVTAARERLERVSEHAGISSTGAALGALRAVWETLGV